MNERPSPEIIRSAELGQHELLQQFGGAVIKLRQQEMAETGV